MISSRLHEDFVGNLLPKLIARPHWSRGNNLQPFSGSKAWFLVRLTRIIIEIHGKWLFLFLFYLLLLSLHRNSCHCRILILSSSPRVGTTSCQSRRGTAKESQGLMEGGSTFDPFPFVNHKEERRHERKREEKKKKGKKGKGKKRKGKEKKRKKKDRERELLSLPSLLSLYLLSPFSLSTNFSSYFLSLKFFLSRLLLSLHGFF